MWGLGCGGGTLAEAVDSRDPEVSVATFPYGQRMCMSILNFCLGEVVESPDCGLLSQWRTFSGHDFTYVISFAVCCSHVLCFLHGGGTG